MPYVYMMRSTRYPDKVKIGYSVNPVVRERFISKSIPGQAVLIFAVRLYTAYAVEQFLHSLLKSLSTDMVGSGKTEWYKPGSIWVGVICAAIAYFLWQAHLHKIYPQESPALFIGASFIGSIVASQVLFILLVWIFLRLIQIIEVGIPIAAIILGFYLGLSK